MQIWASGSHTKTSHLHGGVSVSMCAPGRARSFSGPDRVCRWQALVGTMGITRWCHRGVTGSTRWTTLDLHLLLVIVVKVVSLLEGVLCKPWVMVDVIRMEDGRPLRPIQINQAPCLVHLVLPGFRISTRRDFRESSALPEQTMRKYYVRIDEASRNYGV